MNQDRFHISVWPDTVLDPRLTPIEVDVIGDDLFAYGENVRPYRNEPLPDEWFLRELLEIDRHDLPELTRTIGLISPIQDSVFSLLPTSHLGGWPEIQTATEEVAEREGLGLRGLVVHQDVVWMHLRVARALVRHWAAHLDGADIIEPWTIEGFNTPRSAVEAWTWFEDFMNSALRPFHARVTIGGGLAWASPVPTVFSAACLQLFNHVAMGATWHSCANQPCGRWFFRQRGGAKHGQHRSTGVKYCSVTCAKAQANREWRRRNKERTK